MSDVYTDVIVKLGFQCSQEHALIPMVARLLEAEAQYLVRASLYPTDVSVEICEESSVS